MLLDLRLAATFGLSLTVPALAQTFDWSAAYAKANASLAKLSLQEKVNIVTGVGWDKGPCVGNTLAISSINYPQLCLQDSPLGIRFGKASTAFTPGIQAASTWDIDLIRQRGQFMGAEAKGAGVHVQLGPVAGPLGKIAQGGRNWEGFGPDPYLTGIAMAETIQGMQGSGVQATAKHYILNEQEKNRETMSSHVDDRSMHELYLWPFADSVKAGVASVMCSYNKINGTWACENDNALNKLLKQELGFQGYIMTDWNAQHSTVQAANTGLDMTMPGSDFNGGTILWGPQLTSAVNSGQVAQSRVDDMVRRVLAAWYLVGQDAGYPSINIQANVQGDHKTNVRAVARDGIVLLKNTGSILPLKKPTKLALVGSAAVVNPAGANACTDRGCNVGSLGQGWGSGTSEYPYLSAPYDALKTRTSADGTTLSVSSSDSTGSVAGTVSGADAAIVVVTSDSGEGYITVEGNAGDRSNLDPWHNGNALVQAVAAANKNTIVVVQSVGPVILENILALDGVKAVVWAGLGSQESGNALVDILYGSTSPSGKLPYTIAKSATDYGTTVAAGDDSFPEGLYIDYRHFDQANIVPRYEFGFGLLATVTATITNSGSVGGAEVPQLYLTLPSSAPAAPPKQLRGFTKLLLQPGASSIATFNLRRRDLSYWDVASQNWVVPKGTFGVSVGASSRDVRLTGSITVS
ncbi:glycosyl hydrolase family 3-4 [Diaporthe amygdali]|uniref:glycosyl hydrolase family 3-4 n=1 Tax=Phomopsis amygdali TaxID=1214568 RepID=UPI0022FEFBAE|nr:glycosyl hydrolase family 3-4 [Diaporthe amygdali]KAJ0118582.1 glycosyl hydrolase family 3-4 [Diaporthe amygdali]